MRRLALILVAFSLIAAKPLPTATLYLSDPTPVFGQTVSLSYELNGSIGRHDSIYPQFVCYQGPEPQSPVYVQDGEFTAALGTDPAADYDAWDSGPAECDFYLYVYHYTAQGAFTGYDELAELEFEVGA